MIDMDWLEPGVEVVMYYLGRGMPDVTQDKIKRVNKVTFSLVNSSRRFSNFSGISQENGVWSAGYKVVPVDSDEACAQLKRLRDWNDKRAARNAYDQWNKKATFGNRQALIAALNAITQDEDE